MKRTAVELRRDLQDILDDLPRVLAARDLTAAEAGEYRRATRRAAAARGAEHPDQAPAGPRASDE